jgi:hypothetical protein
MSPAGGAHGFRLCGPGGEALDAGCEFVKIPSHKTGFAVPHNESWASTVCDYRGYSGGQGLEHYVPISIGSRGKCEHVHVRIGARQRLSAQDSSEIGLFHARAEPGLLGALADNQEAEIGKTFLNQYLLDIYQVRDVLSTVKRPT